MLPGWKQTTSRLTAGRVETVSIGTQPHATEACTPFSIAESQSFLLTSFYNTNTYETALG